MNAIHVEVDAALLAEVRRGSGLMSDREVVELALRRMLAARVDPALLTSIQGIGWDGDLDEMRSGMGVEDL